MRRIFAVLVLAIAMLIPSGVVSAHAPIIHRQVATPTTYAPHTSNQTWDGVHGYWVADNCDSPVINFETILWTEVDHHGVGLMTCAKIENLNAYSVGDTTLNWNNKASSLWVVWKASPNFCMQFWDLGTYTGHVWQFEGDDLPDLGRVAFDNAITSLRKITIGSGQSCEPG